MKYLVEMDKGKVMSYLLSDDGRAAEIHADDQGDGLKLGDIVIGRVEKVAENTGACFVEVEKGVKGYLPFEEMCDATFTRKGPSQKVRQGDELVVQVSREAFGSKGMSLTTRLQLSGRYLVLEKCGMGLGISKKIGEERRNDLRENLLTEEVSDELQKALGTCGIVVRTNAQDAVDDLIRRELIKLARDLQHILLTAPYRPGLAVLYRQPDRWLKRTDSLPEGKIDQILTDDRDLFEKLSAYLSPSLGEKLVFYEDRMISMHNVFSLTRELGQALSRKVNMKSGASLVIEQTEALVSIDVNSAHFISGKDKEKAALKVNLEAACEVARQIRLRGLSGMILVDFINMQEEESYDLLMKQLRAAVASDPMKTNVVDRTALGLVELTRRKVEAPLSSQIYGG